MKFYTVSLSRGAAAAQQVATTYPGVPVSLKQTELEPPTWELSAGPDALPLGTTWSWPDGETPVRVHRLVESRLLLGAGR